jgi:hypothetical protein
MNDTPVATLKYLKRPMLAPMVAVPMLCAMLLFGILVYVPESWLEFVMVKCLCIVLLFILLMPIVELLIFKEIRLYKDRIVKEWKFFGVKELKLEGARLQSEYYSGMGSKSFYKQNSNPQWDWLLSFFLFTKISYGEYFTDPANLKEFHSALAQLTGRRVEEFDGSGTMKTLVKKEKL